MSAVRISPAPSFEAPVRLTVAGADEKATAIFRFAHKGKTDLRAWVNSAPGRADVELLGEVVRGWRLVITPDGDEVPFSPEALAALLEAYPASGTEIFDAYLAAFYEARTKN